MAYRTSKYTKGLYFTGFSEEDGNPDVGDSAITETVGVGAMAMVGAPGVTRFVGAGGFEDALATSNEMAKSVKDTTQHSQFQLGISKELV